MLFWKEKGKDRKQQEIKNKKSTKCILSEKMEQQDKNGGFHHSEEYVRAILALNPTINILKEKDWQAGILFCLEECIFDSSHKLNESAILIQSNGRICYQCYHNSCKGKTWQDVKSLLQLPEKKHSFSQQQKEMSENLDIPYSEKENGIFWNKITKEGEVTVCLTNFTAQVVCDIKEDDGLETRRIFEIEAHLKGRTYHFSVPSAHFANLNWVTEQLGAEAVIYPGQMLKDHTKTAIQLISGNIPVRTVYTHLGWHNINGLYYYLTTSGAIGTEGLKKDIEVCCESMQRYFLPEPPQEDVLKNAIHSSMKILDIVRSEITYPLYSLIWLSPLGICDFSGFIAGKSGNGKTELASLIQQHWGAEMDSHHLPASWKSTANFNEILAFLAKDAILVVDDFCPRGNKKDIEQKYKEADNLFRGQANRKGRGRLRPDGTTRTEKYPRGIILSTGEDVPPGESLQARMLILELDIHDLNWDALRELQIEARQGMYAQAMAGYIHWLSQKYATIQSQITKEISDLRDRIYKENLSKNHRRTPTILAQLIIGWQYFLHFANEAGALTEEQCNYHLEKAWTSITTISEKQSEYHQENDLIVVFFKHLRAALVAGKMHIACLNGSCPSSKIKEMLGWLHDNPTNPKGERIGWIDEYEGFVYLEPTACYKAVQCYAQESGESLPATKNTLWKRLNERGMLIRENKRTTFYVRKTIHETQRNVIQIPAQIILDENN